MTDLSSSTPGGAVPDDLGARVAELEAITAIRHLRHRASRLLDDLVNDGTELDLDGLVTSDYRLVVEPFGWAFDRPTLPGALRDLRDRLQLSLQYVGSELLTVAGDAASGEWMVWQPLTVAGDAMLLAGRLHERYGAEPDGWRIEASRLEVVFLCPYEAGWASDRFAVGDLSDPHPHTAG